MSTTFDDVPKLDSANVHNESSAGGTHGHVSLRTLADRLAADRVRRGDWFDGSLFSDPAWELLLGIYRDHLDGRDSSVRKLLVSSFLKPHTAIRWIDLLAEQGAVAWCDAPAGAKTHVRLTERSIVGITCYLRVLAKRWGLRLTDQQAS